MVCSIQSFCFVRFLAFLHFKFYKQLDTEIWQALKSSLHLFVKKQAIDKLHDALHDYQYEVLIEDVQKVVEKSTSNSKYSNKISCA